MNQEYINVVLAEICDSDPKESRSSCEKALKHVVALYKQKIKEGVKWLAPCGPS